MFTIENSLPTFMLTARSVTELSNTNQITLQGPMQFDPNNVIFSAAESDTDALGASLGTELSGGEIVALHGDLGAGKTVFARGLSRGMGVDEPICSPTFTVVQEYQGDRYRLYHIDLYRLSGVDDALAFGIEDYLEDEEAVTVIEWSERISELLSGLNVVHVDIQHLEIGRNIRVFRS